MYCKNRWSYFVCSSVTRIFSSSWAVENSSISCFCSWSWIFFSSRSLSSCSWCNLSSRCLKRRTVSCASMLYRLSYFISFWASLRTRCISLLRASISSRKFSTCSCSSVKSRRHWSIRVCLIFKSLVKSSIRRSASRSYPSTIRHR